MLANVGHRLAILAVPMTRKDSWFESTTWTPEIAAKFDERFARTKSQRRHPLTTQAGLLVKHGFVDEGVALYRRAAALEELGGDERSMVLGWLALMLIAELRFDEAVEAARAGVQASRPRERKVRGARTPEELLAFALRRRGNGGDDAEALALLSNEDPSQRESLDVYRGRWAGVDINGKAYADVEDLAETFAVSVQQTNALNEADLDALFAGTPAGLTALDRLWCKKPPMFGKFQPLRRRILFEVGGYLGRVLCRAGGTWEDAPPDTPLVTRKVLLAGRAIDPFEAAYDALLRFMPLARWYARATARA